MHAHYLQHVPFEGPGYIENWLHLAGYKISHTPLFENRADFAPLNTVDFLIVMGGPMSVNDEKTYPWLVAEKSYVRCAIALGKPVLGVCLGAQLIASALGAKVYPNREKEIGWFLVDHIRSSDPSHFHFPQSIEVFHWHGETFDLPPEAIRLAESDGCKNQAFQIGQSVIGLQFHLETTPKLAEDIVKNCAHELTDQRYIQSAQEILSAQPESYERMHQLMAEILAFLLPENR